MKYKPFRIGLKLWLRIEIFEKSQFCNKIKKNYPFGWKNPRSWAKKFKIEWNVIDLIYYNKLSESHL